MRLGEWLAAEAGASAVNPAANSGAILAAASAAVMEGDGPVGVFHFQAKEKLSDFHFSIDRITLSDRNKKNVDILVTDARTSDSGSTAPDAGTTGAGNADTGAASGGSGSGKSDTGAASGGSGSGKSDTGTASGGSGSGKSDTGAANSGSGSGKSDTGTASGGSGSGKSDTGTASGGGGTTSMQTAPPETPAPFSDIAGTWAEDYIRTASERNIFQGYPDGTFRPNNRLTRAQFMMALWNLAGRPEAPEQAPFTDMRGQIENFQNAVSWAYAKGYVNGTSDVTFSPGEPLTRQAAVKILFAYHGSVRGPETMMSNVYDSLYSDSGRISAWARDAMYWAVYQKILSGTSDSTLEPGGTVTRAQLAAIMVRYLDRFPS